MKLTNRQIILGSLQPVLFCIAMYCIILFTSVFLCSSIYHAFKGGNKAAVKETRTASITNLNHTTPSTAMEQ
ncbi:MAG: hypothetical protein JST63_20715 [Bacteroidetes bacterium]|nr:hypothetical protein [Bacteroidota bacterium]